MGQDIKDKAGVIAPPPLIFAALLTAGLLVHWCIPVHFMPHGWMLRLAIAIPLLAVSAILAALSYKVLWQNNTPVNPNKPTAKIVTEGPFCFTRNPLYVSLMLLYGAIAVLANAFWSILLLPALFVIFKFGVVSREERYLERKFGDEYLQYKRKVRRWI